jgi:Asp-tRNA(Asn)/Glu-tRNA(Gln) amidotransferase A subunit family amidase
LVAGEDGDSVEIDLQKAIEDSAKEILMNTTDDLLYVPAIELAAAIRRRQLSPVELLDAVLTRLEDINPRINAFTIVLADEARVTARRAEDAIIRGDDAGPIHGIPFTIKDLTPTKGIATMQGSKAFADMVPDVDGITVERLRQAGGIFLGKTTTPEFGNKGITESPLTGTTNNPWKLTYITGGSSGGAAAAVAAGLGPLAQGSDGAGSIRIPASCCGVVGLKPSFGRVPYFRASGGYKTLSCDGPITRTVGDTALMLTVLAGDDDRDPFAIAETGNDYREAIAGASVRGTRIAYSRDLGLGPVDPEVITQTDRAARLFTDELGANVEEATPEVPHPEESMLTIWRAMYGLIAVDDLLPRIDREDIDPALLELAERADTLSAYDYLRAAYGFRDRYYRAMLRFFGEYDLLITPTLATPPFPHPGWKAGPDEIAGQPINSMLGWLLTYPFNLTGQPAITVPCGFSAEGLPIGLQIVGRRHADAAVLRAAAAYEEAAPWAGMRPTV